MGGKEADWRSGAAWRPQLGASDLHRDAENGHVWNWCWKGVGRRACVCACAHASMCMYVCRVLREHVCVHASVCTSMHACMCVYTRHVLCVFTGTLPVCVLCVHGVCVRVCSASGMCVSVCMSVWLVYMCACLCAVRRVCARVHVSMCRCALVVCIPGQKGSEGFLQPRHPRILEL